MNNLVELKKEELKEVEGGGWLAAVISDFTAWAACDCNARPVYEYRRW